MVDGSVKSWRKTGGGSVGGKSRVSGKYNTLIMTFGPLVAENSLRNVVLGKVILVPKKKGRLGACSLRPGQITRVHSRRLASAPWHLDSEPPKPCLPATQVYRPKNVPR